MNKEERENRRQAELAAGRRLTTKNMLQGLLEQVCSDYKIEGWQINDVGNDPRQWTVTVTLAPGVTHTENAWVFPSDELKAMVMFTKK